MNLCRVTHLNTSFCVNVINQLFIIATTSTNCAYFCSILQRSGRGITVVILVLSKTSNSGWNFLFILSSKGLKQMNNTLLCSTSTSRTRAKQSNLMMVITLSLERNVLECICKSGLYGLCIAKLWKCVCWIIVDDLNQCSIWFILSFLSRLTPTLKFTLSPTIRNRIPDLLYRWDLHWTSHPSYVEH